MPVRGTTLREAIDVSTGMEQIDSKSFRQVFAHLPTAVTVVTAYTPAGPVGMAANSVTSVSLEPPLILLCPAKSSSTWPVIRAVGSFCVNVMAEHHEQLTRRFAAKGEDRFGDVCYEARTGGPALGDAVAWIDCQLRDEYEAGDHTIAVARVTAMTASTGVAPLVFCRGGYGGFRGQ